MGTDRLRALNDAFCRRHLPPQAAGVRALLAEGEAAAAFTPDDDDLGRCVADYAALVEEAVRDDPCDLAAVADASGLTLAYLRRGLDAGRPLADSVGNRLLAQRLRALLRESATWFGPPRWEEVKREDGFRHADAVASALETVEEEQAFRARFLPAGVPSARALLVDFRRDFPFTPSAAELQQCLDGYAGLLRTATRVGCVPVRWCVGGTELALAYLARGLEAGTPLPERATVNRVVGMIRKALADARPPPGGCAGTTATSAWTSWPGCWRSTRRRASRGGTSCGRVCGRRWRSAERRGFAGGPACGRLEETSAPRTVTGASTWSQRTRRRRTGSSSR
jgi:hypothetical protein